MSMVRAKPTSPGRRFVISPLRRELHAGGPWPTLVAEKRKTGGRNNNGHITTRHIGGGHRQKYRLIDFTRAKDGIVGEVVRIEYDPNRTAHIALIKYKDGAYHYILAPKGLVKGMQIVSGADAPIKVGNALPLENIPVGTTIHAVELKPKKGAQLGRTAGAAIQYLAKEGNYASLRLRSGEIRRVLTECRATIGEVGNQEHGLTSLGKAGAKRHRGIRPTVRGVAMNPVDHPLGGGEGKTSGGRHPCSPTAVLAKGYKTRRNKRTENMIVKHRHHGRDKAK